MPSMPNLLAANRSSIPFTGWLRCSVDTAKLYDTNFVKLGLPTGYGRRRLHAFVQALPPQTTRLVEFGAPQRNDRAQHNPAVDVDALIKRGMPTIGGTPFTIHAFMQDGPALHVELRARWGDGFISYLWVWVYPGEEDYVEGELVVCRSGPVQSHTTEVGTLSQAVRLEWGDAFVHVAGREDTSPLLAAGTTFGEGQARSYPIAFGWIDSMNDVVRAAALARMNLGVAMIDTSTRLYATGSPTESTTEQAQAFASVLPHELARLHRWDASNLGVAARSANAGSQEDQVFVGRESTVDPHAAMVRYVVALQQSRRPCHHVLVNGNRWDQDPSFWTYAMPWWSGRPHPYSTLYQQKQWPAEWQTHGWAGPDREHWLMNTLATSYLLTGSPALRWQIEHQATLFLAQETVNGSYITSMAGTARDVGWAGMVFAHLFRCLDDGALRDHVVDRGRDRLDLYVRTLSNKPGGIWDPRQDVRITGDLTGYTKGTMMWQQAVGAFGLDLMAELLGHDEATELAREAAAAVLVHAWRKQPDGRWIFWDNVGYSEGDVLPESEYVEGKGAHRTGWFDHSWAIMGIATLLRTRPHKHADAAEEIWKQHSTDVKWRVPGVEA